MKILIILHESFRSDEELLKFRLGRLYMAQDDEHFTSGEKKAQAKETLYEWHFKEEQKRKMAEADGIERQDQEMRCGGRAICGARGTEQQQQQQ